MTSNQATLFPLLTLQLIHGPSSGVNHVTPPATVQMDLCVETRLKVKSSNGSPPPNQHFEQFTKYLDKRTVRQETGLNCWPNDASVLTTACPTLRNNR